MPVWRNPAAWFGLAALAIPIAVHLLARTRAQVVAFPSLRFIDISRLAARKRRRLSDLALLALRLLAVALAVAAWADPLFLTASRRAAWGSRVSRAVIIDTSASMTRGHADDEAARAAARELEAQQAQQEQQQQSPPSSQSPAPSRDAAATVLRKTTVRAASLPDGVARAVAWLRASPPSRREIVVISDFQSGKVDAALLGEVPADVGLRFTRVGAGVAAAREANAETRPVSARRATANANASDFEWQRSQVHVSERATAIARRTPVASAAAAAIAITPSDTGFTLTPFGLRVSASDADRPVALATLQAVLAEGVPAPAGSPANQPHPVHLMLIAGSARTGAQAPRPTLPLPPAADVVPIAMPWMADTLQHLATDRVLAAAVGAGVADAVAVEGGAEGTAGVPPAPWRVILTDARATPRLFAAATRSGELLLDARVDASAPAAAFLIRAALTALAAPDTLPGAEVRTIPDNALNLWTRPATEPSTEALRQVEDSDRRWFWAAALALLLMEMWLRRDRQRAPREEQLEAHEHAA